MRLFLSMILAALSAGADSSGIHVIQGDFTAERLLLEADKLLSGLDTNDKTVARLLSLARLCYQTEQKELGDSYETRARKIVLESQSKLGLLHGQLIAHYLRQGNLQNAYEIALEHPRLTRYLIAQKMMSAELQHGDWEKAARYLGYQCQYKKKRFDMSTYTYVKFAIRSHDSGMLDKAISLIEEENDSPIEVVKIKSKVWSGLAQNAWDSGEPELAVQNLDKAIDVLRSVDSLRHSTEAYKLLVRRAIRAKQLNLATIKNILKEAEQNGVDLYEVKSNLAALMGNDSNQLEAVEELVRQFQGTLEQTADMKVILAYGYVNGDQAEKAIAEVNSIEDANFRASRTIALAKYCFEKEKYDLANKLAKTGKSLVDALPEDPNRVHSRNRDIGLVNRIQYISESMEQRKYLSPGSIDPEYRFEILMELAEILIAEKE